VYSSGGWTGVYSVVDWYGVYSSGGWTGMVCTVVVDWGVHSFPKMQNLTNTLHLVRWKSTCLASVRLGKTRLV